MGAQGKQISPAECPAMVFPNDSHAMVKKTLSLGELWEHKLSDKQARMAVGRYYDHGVMLTSLLCFFQLLLLKFLVSVVLLRESPHCLD